MLTFLQFKQLSLLHFKAKIAKMLSTWDVLIREYFCIVIEFLTGSTSDTDPSGLLLLQRLKQLTCFLQVSLRLQCLWVSCSWLGSRRTKHRARERVGPAREGLLFHAPGRACCFIRLVCRLVQL